MGTIVGMLVFTNTGTFKVTDHMCISLVNNKWLVKPEDDFVTLPAYETKDDPDLLKMKFKGHKIFEDRKILIEKIFNPIGNSHAMLMIQKLRTTLREIKTKFEEAGQPGSTTSPS